MDTLIRNTEKTRNAGLASMVLLVYDHVITFDGEVELVWFKPWSWTSSLFFWNRYGTFVILLFDTVVSVGGGPTDSFCLSWQKFQGWTGWLTNMTVEIIIIVRIAAMYLQDRHIVMPVLVLFSAQAIGMAVIIGYGFASMKAVHEPEPGFRACALLGVPPLMFLYWAINLAFEAILFVLALIKASQHLARRRGMRPRWSGPRILNVLVRDSIMYFLVIFVTYVMNLVSWSTGDRSLYQLAISLAIALRASMGSRLLLNVREAYYGDEDPTSENALSSIRWRQRNTRSVVDFLPESTRDTSTTGPGFERESSPDVPQPGPSSSTYGLAQIKSPSKLRFEDR